MVKNGAFFDLVGLRQICNLHCLRVKLFKLVQAQAIGLLYAGSQGPQKIRRSHVDLKKYIFLKTHGILHVLRGLILNFEYISTAFLKTGTSKNRRESYRPMKLLFKMHAKNTPRKVHWRNAV